MKFLVEQEYPFFYYFSKIPNFIKIGENYIRKINITCSESKGLPEGKLTLIEDSYHNSNTIIVPPINGTQEISINFEFNVKRFVTVDHFPSHLLFNYVLNNGDSYQFSTEWELGKFNHFVFHIHFFFL